MSNRGIDKPKRNEPLIHTKTWMNFKNFMLSKKPEKNICCMILFT